MFGAHLVISTLLLSLATSQTRTATRSFSQDPEPEAMPLAISDSPRLLWNDHWERFSVPEYVATTLLIATDVVLLTLVSTPHNARFRGGALFDDSIRDALVAETFDGRRRASKISDFIYIPLALYPLFVDAGVMAGVVHGSSDVAIQLALINLQSLVLAGVVAVTTERVVGRERPAGEECSRDPGYDPGCGTGRLNVSFLSGHSAITFASASLVCTSHAHLPLYGGGIADAAACVGGMSLATTSAVLRIVADAHYATDVLAGALVGLLSGYLVPSILHYGFGGHEDDLPYGDGAGPARSWTAVIAPMDTQDAFVVGVRGTF